MSTTCPHNMVNFGPLTVESEGEFGEPQQISRLGYVNAPASLNGRQPNFARCLAVYLAGTLHIQHSKLNLHQCLALSYIGSVYCKAIEQRASVERCVVVQGMELLNFCRRRHLYSAGQRVRHVATCSHSSFICILRLNNKMLIRQHKARTCVLTRDVLYKAYDILWNFVLLI